MFRTSMFCEVESSQLMRPAKFQIALSEYHFISFRRRLRDDSTFRIRDAASRDETVFAIVFSATRGTDTETAIGV